MASTTKTANLELSQFVGTDKPAWLTDYNGDMQKIDDGYKKLKDANTATQADLDATKQDLSGSQTDINDVKANVQALEAQDIAIGNRLTVLEGNYDTMHHEVAINQQDIADMEPYAKIAANRKANMAFGDNVSSYNINSDSIQAVIGVIDNINDIARNIGFGHFGEPSGIREGSLQIGTNKVSDNSALNSAIIRFPASGLHFEYVDDERIAIHFYVTANKIMTVRFEKTSGVSLSITENGVGRQLFNIPVTH